MATVVVTVVVLALLAAELEAASRDRPPAGQAAQGEFIKKGTDLERPAPFGLDPDAQAAVVKGGAPAPRVR